MSFQGYLKTIKEKTGKSAADCRKLAEKKGFTEKGDIKQGIKAGDIVQWLKEDYDLDMDMQGYLCIAFRKER